MCVSQCFHYFRDKWSMMISSPLITALEEDEGFLLRVMRSAEKDPNLRLERMEVNTSCDGRDNNKFSYKRINLKGYSPLQRRTFLKTLLLKRQSEYGVTRRQLQRDPAFCNEATVYEHIIPVLKAFSRDPTLLPFPSCLFVSNSVLILQDLTAEGYKSVNRLHGMDLTHSKLAIQALGKFHGISLALKHKDSATFKRLTSQLKEVIFVSETMPFFSASMEHSLKAAISALKGSFGIGKLVIDDAVQKLQSLQGRIFNTLVSLVTPREPMSVICHGDFWINNILFHYKNDDNATVDDVKFVDLQVFRYGSLATDLLHFLYTSLQPGLSSDYFDMLLQLYHTSLSETMSILTPKAPVITLDEIIEEIETYALYGLLMGFLLLPAISATEEDNDTILYEKDSKKQNINKENYENVMTYSDRVKNLVLEFIDRGFI